MRKLKLFFACLLMAVLSIGQVWATEVSFTKADFAGQGTANTGSEVSASKSGVTVTYSKGYCADESLRCYAHGALSITATTTIEKINFTTTGGKTGGLDSEVEVNATSYSVADLASQARFTEIKVTLSDGNTPQPSLSVGPTVIDFGTVDQNAVVASKTVEVSYENLTGSVTYSGLTSPFSASGSISASGDEITIAANTATIGNYSQTLTVQSTADSKSQEVTVKMNVVEPFDGLKLDFVLSANNLSLPTSKSTSVAGECTYTIGTTDYTFYATDAQGSSDGGIYFGGSYTMIYSSNALGLPAISGYKLVKVEAFNSTGCSTTTAVSIREGQTSNDDIVSGGTAQTWGTQGSKYTYNLTGTAENTMYYLYVATKNCQLTGLTLYYEEAEAPLVPKAAKPTFETGDESFIVSTNVTLACTTEGAKIYYTVNGDVPTSGSTLYEGAIPVSATTTIKAITVADGYDNSDVAEKTFTKATVLTVAQALEAIDALDDNGTIANQYVAGVISQIDSYNGTYHSITYWISADGATTNQLQVYGGLIGNAATALGKEAFSAKEDLELGDEVVVTGTLKLHNSSVYEFDKNNTIYSFTRPVAQTYSITYVENGANEDIDDDDAATNLPNPLPTVTKSGKVFGGWWTTSTFEDGSQAVAGAQLSDDVILYAKWNDLSQWAYTYTSNVTIASNEEKQVTIDGDDYPAAKSNKGTSATITLPQGVTKIHLHLVAWKGEAQTVTVSGDCFNEDKNLTIIANDAVSGTVAKYDLGESGVDYYFSLTPDNAVAANEVITITAASNKRFVLFGVNQEGGIVPELQSLELSGDLENKTYEAGASINPAGLTVMGTYTLGGTPQTPVDVTDQVEDWLYDALQAGDEAVTISAKIGTVTSNSVEISGLTVTDPTPRFETNPSSYISFGSKVQGTDIAARDLEVTLVNVSNASVEITGTGAAAFSVDEDALTGNATLHVSASSANVGTFAATLTISDEAGVAADKEISLSLTITEPETPETAVSTTSKWVVATAADLVDGAEVLITGVKDDVTYAMGGQNKNNRAAVAASIDGEGVLTPGENTMSFTLVAQETEGVFALRTSNGKYLYAAASGDNHMKTQNEVDVNAKWTISATSAVAESSSNRNVMQFNGGSSLFSCYNTASQSAIQFYVPKQNTPVDPTPDYTRTVEINRYGTICLPNGGTIEGAKLYDIDYYDGTSTLYLLEVNGNAMVAGRPYIFLPSATSLEVFYTDDADEDAGTYRGLVGSYSEKTILVNDGNYILYENAYYLVNSAARVGENRAYIHMASVPTTPYQQQGAPRRRVAMNVYSEQTTTDIDALNASEAPVKMIIDGQLFIIRGEKMFDATGRLVK